MRPEDRRSTSGYCVFVSRNLWKSKKQAIVSRSCAEFEYRAMAQYVREIIDKHEFYGYFYPFSHDS